LVCPSALLPELHNWLSAHNWLSVHHASAVARVCLSVAQGWRVALFTGACVSAIPEFKATAKKFDPERWLQAPTPGAGGCPHAQLIKNPKGFIPFGDGSRKCAGYALAFMHCKVRALYRQPDGVCLSHIMHGKQDPR
jgi:Cytochrome P450